MMRKIKDAVCYVAVLVIALISDVIISADGANYKRTRDSLGNNLLASFNGELDIL